MTTKRRTFDLETEARRLYQMARAKNDFTGAASVLRLMRDLRPSGEAARAADRDPLYVDVSKLSEEDFAELGRLIDALDAFAMRVNGIAIALTPVVVDAITAPSTPAAQPAVVEEPLDEDEIDVSDLIADGVDLSWIPDEEPS
jgi:hypothetical protein